MSTPKFHSLWAINGPLETDRLRTQLDRFRAAGLDGVVFHPRFYPGTPPYLSDQYFAHVSDAIIHAKSIGLAFWLYDEDGWPSGTVGGQLLQQFPEHAQRWVGLFAQAPGIPLAEFVHDGKPWYLAEREWAGVDYLDPRLCQRFIGMTYERYRDGLSPEAFAHVEAFFCDEPEFGLGHLHDALPPDGAIPWTPCLPQLYRKRFGEDLSAILPALFFRSRAMRTHGFGSGSLSPICFATLSSRRSTHGAVSMENCSRHTSKARNILYFRCRWWAPAIRFSGG